MRQRGSGLLAASGWLVWLTRLASLTDFRRLASLTRLRRGSRLSRSGRLMVVLMHPVGGGTRAGLECAAFLSGGGCSFKAHGFACTGFPPRATAASAVPASSAASAAAALLAALSTALARNLTLLSAACLDAGARLAPWRGPRSACCGFRRTCADIPIPLGPFLIPIVLMPIAIAPVTGPSITAPSIAVASLGPPAIAVTAALTALGAARLARMLPPAIAAHLAAAARAVSRCGRRSSRRWRDFLRGLRRFRLAGEEFLEPAAKSAIGGALGRRALHRRRGCSGRRWM